MWHSRNDEHTIVDTLLAGSDAWPPTTRSMGPANSAGADASDPVDATPRRRHTAALTHRRRGMGRRSAQLGRVRGRARRRRPQLRS